MSHNVFKKMAFASVALLMAANTSFAQEPAAAPAVEPVKEEMSFKMTGKIREYFGQYNSGAEDSAAYFQEFGEANLAADISSGAISGYFELESRTNALISAIQRRLDAKFGDLKLSFGTIVPKESYAIADDSATGTMTSDSQPFGFYKGELIKTELDGFRAEYKIEKVKVGVTLYEADALNANSYNLVKAGTTETTDSNGDTSDTYLPSTSHAKVSEYKSGSATQFGAYGDVGPIYFHVSRISSMTDDPSSSADTALSHSGNQVGLRYAITDGFTVSVDAGAKTLAQDEDYNKVYGDSALQVKYTLESKQNIVVTVANMSYVDEKTTDESKDYAVATTNLIYSIPMSKGTELKVLYASETNTPALTTSDAVTKSFLGAGLFAKF